MLNKKFTVFNLITLLCLISFSGDGNCSAQGDQVSKWADEIGKDLWTLGQAITRYSDIKQKYTFLNAKVGEKNPKQLLREIKEKVSIMINRKMNAIKRIQVKAETAAEESDYNSTEQYQYYSSKYSYKIKNLPKSIRYNRPMYIRMKLNNDTHFYNLPVNTNHSSVHVPVNVYDREAPVAAAVRWSEALDEVFKKNYEIDPALSWQYFGSSTGIMRHYPAQHWEDRKKDLLMFDCRIRTWFIEAATCTKDVVILMDNSGSMDGMGHHIGYLTACSILDTLSNNDFVNVLNYSSTTNYTIPCFENTLVQATEENIIFFKEVISRMEPDGKTNLDQALEVAFELLAKYRRLRDCDDTNSNCNQAIMIITDSLEGNLNQTVRKYNYLNNGSHIPVRIFTYLVGQEAANLQDIKWISCSYRGYFSHVQSLEQVTASVFKYISVIARPLVLQAEDHPVSWTHAYADLTYDDATDNTVNEPYRLLSSAAIPCYGTYINNMTGTRTPYLLGVAGTDVPLDEFERLLLPYKIGVNAYSFIVSNNGYVLMHPDLRPMARIILNKKNYKTNETTIQFKGILKDNYNSIDLTQVEQHHSDLPAVPRRIVKSLKSLRQALVDGDEGSMHGINLQFHYDDMRRVHETSYDYYYTPIEGTPFTMGIAIPAKYGNYSLEVGDEILINKQTGENLTTFFNGKWKIHPKWVYCKYHYLEGHEFSTPEKELLHFLGKMYDRDFKWESQYEAKGKTLADDDYYCDIQLVQRLIFDARNTHEPFSEKWRFKPRELPLFQRYNASLRFLATMSGLTRWDYIFGEPKQDEKNKIKEFGDLHPKAINEKWYKSAVLQHQYGESFVYSVPFDAATIEDPLVTGSFAIFPSDKGLKAPGSVVGFQFSQLKLQARFKEISAKLTRECSHCGRCNDTLNCYILDSSGYIIVSDIQEDTGRFFGEIEGDILYAMLEENIFKKITIFDYQALCFVEVKNGSSSSPVLLTPIRFAQMALEWIVMKFVWFILELNVHNFLNLITYAQELVSDMTEVCQNFTDTDNNCTNTTEDSDFSMDQSEEEEIEHYPCETKIDLFVLQQEIFDRMKFEGEINRTNERNFYVKKIPNSNLAFVAINTTTPISNFKYYTTDPQQITKRALFEMDFMNSTLLPCQKLDLNNLTRRRLTGCYNEHPLEHEITDCGKATYIKLNYFLFMFIVSLWCLLNYNVL